MTNYQISKIALKERAKDAFIDFPNDKPAIRMTINDNLDYLAIDYDLSEYQRNLLANYACTLHPNN